MSPTPTSCRNPIPRSFVFCPRSAFVRRGNCGILAMNSRTIRLTAFYSVPPLLLQSICWKFMWHSAGEGCEPLLHSVHLVGSSLVVDTSSRLSAPSSRVPLHSLEGFHSPLCRPFLPTPATLQPALRPQLLLIHALPRQTHKNRINPPTTTLFRTTALLLHLQVLLYPPLLLRHMNLSQAM